MKKIFKIFTIILFMFLLTDTVSAEDYGISCTYDAEMPDGKIIWNMSTLFLGDEEGVNEFNYIPNTVCDNTTSECLAQLGALNIETGALTCPSLYQKSSGEIVISKDDIAGATKVSFTKDCSFPHNCNFYGQITEEEVYDQDTYTCTYSNPENNSKTMKIDVTYNSEYVNGLYKITYPDGVEKTFEGTEINGNVLPSKDCEDIYYINSNRKIKTAIEANESVSLNASLESLCRNYGSDNIEHYCSGVCEYEKLTCEDFGYNTASCGSTDGIPKALPILTSNLIDLLKIATPIILIIMGMIDFFRATMSGDDKSMNESKSRFIKRIIAGIIVFLVISVVELSFALLNDHNGIGSDVRSCLDCFINNHCFMYEEK